MGRPLWFVAGAGVGVYAAARARRLADDLTPDGLRDRARSLRLGARLFAEEVQQGRAEAETELRARLGLVPHGRPEIAGPETAPEATAATPDAVKETRR